MTSHTRFRRGLAVVAGAGAAAALTLLPGTAHAAVKGLYAATGESDVRYVGPTSGGTCTLTSGDDNPVGKVSTFSHGTKRSSVDLKTRYTSSDNSSDVTTVKGHLDSALTLKRKAGDLKSFALSAGGTLSVSHAVPGSACQATGSMLAQVPQLQFTEHHKGWFYLTRDTKKPNSFTEFILVNLNTNSAVALDVYSGTKSHVTSRVKLGAGNYMVEQTQIGLEIGSTGVLKSAQLSKRAEQTVHLTGQFKPLGK
jgi:hypothetical protein